MNLGDAGRKTIKGHDRDYYVVHADEVHGTSFTVPSKEPEAGRQEILEFFFAHFPGGHLKLPVLNRPVNASL